MNLASLRNRLSRLAGAVPAADIGGQPPRNSEEMIREVAQMVADDDEREAALAALPAEEQAAARAEARLEFLRGLERDTAEDRAEWAAMHQHAVRVLADPAHSRMVPVLRRFVEMVAGLPPATPAERALLAQERRQ